MSEPTLYTRTIILSLGQTEMVDPKTLTEGDRLTRGFWQGGSWYDMGELVSDLTIDQRRDLIWRVTAAIVDVIKRAERPVQPTPKPRRPIPEGFRVLEGGAR